MRVHACIHLFGSTGFVWSERFYKCLHALRGVVLAVVSADGLLLPPLACKAEKNSKSRCLLLLCLLSLVGPLTCMQLTRELPGSFPGARRAAGFPPVAGGVTASGGLQVWTPVTPLLAADPVKD